MLEGLTAGLVGSRSTLIYWPRLAKLYRRKLLVKSCFNLVSLIIIFVADSSPVNSTSLIELGVSKTHAIFKAFGIVEGVLRE
jgi:hypothetical protein